MKDVVYDNQGKFFEALFDSNKIYFIEIKDNQIHNIAQTEISTEDKCQ